MCGWRGGGGVLAVVATVELKLFVEGAVKLSASLLFHLAFVSRGNPFSLSFPLSVSPLPSLFLAVSWDLLNHWVVWICWVVWLTEHHAYMCVEEQGLAVRLVQVDLMLLSLGE